jgi:hypothetical protein
LRGLKAFRVEKIAKNFALLDRLQIFAEFLHGLDPEGDLLVRRDGWLESASKRTSAEGIGCAP